MSTSTPRISVLIPMFNMEKYAKECLDTLFRQTFRDFEVIAVDDCSTDDTTMILRSYEMREPRLHVIYHPVNRGTFCARKSALTLATGEYVVNLDADDYLDENAFETLLEVVDSTHADIVAFGEREVDGSTGKRLDRTKDGTPFTLAGPRIFEAVFRSHAYSWSLCFKLIRRELFVQADEKLPDCYCIFAEDFMHFIVIAGLAKSMVSTGKILYNYRQDTGITGKGPRTLEQFRRSMSMLNALKAVRLYLVKEGLYQGFSEAFALREKEQIRMLYKQWANQLAPDDKLTALAEMKREYNPERIDALFAEYDQEEKNGGSKADTPSWVNRFVRPESCLWFFLKRLSGKWKFRKNRRFYDC